MAPNGSPHMIVYMSTIQMESLPLTVLRYLGKNVDLGSRSKVIAPNERPCMISYNMSVIKMGFLSLIVFELFEKNVYVTFDFGASSKVMVPNFYITICSTIFNLAVQFSFILHHLDAPCAISVCYNKILALCFHFSVAF